MAERVGYEISAKDGTARATQSAASNFNKVTGSVARLTAEVVTLAGGAGFGLLVQQAFTVGDQIQKTAIQLGASTEALSELQVAAELSGTSFETLTRGLTRLERSTFEAMEGSKQYAESFEALGIEVEQFIDLRPEDKLRVIAQALSETENVTERNALAMRLLGRSGVELIPILERGAEGVDELRERARSLGITLTQEGADAIAESNDALTDLEFAMRGVAQQIAIQLSPEIQGLAEWLGDVIPKALIVVTSAFQRVGRQMAAVGRAANFLVEGELSLLVEHMKVMKKEFFDKSFMDEVTERLNEFDKEIEVTEGSLNSYNNANRRVASTKRQLALDMSHTNKMMREEQKLLDELARKQEERDRTILGMINRLIREHDALTMTRKELVAVEAAARGATESEIEHMQNLVEMIEIHKQQQEELERNSEAARELGLTFTSAFEEAVSGGKDLREVLAGLLQDIAKLALRKNVTEPLLGALSGGGGGGLFGGGGGGIFGDLFGGLFGGGGPVLDSGLSALILRSGGMVDGAGSSTSVPAAAFLGAPHMRSGGRIGGDGIPIVAHPGEEVLSADDPRNARNGGGMGINITNNITFSGDSSGVTPSSVAAALRESEKRTIQAIRTEIRRGGPMARLVGAR